MHASSGTTGKPTVVGYTREDIETWSEVMARSIRAAGGVAADKVHVSYGYGLFTGGLGAHYGAEKLGCAVIPMSGGQTEKQVQLICDFDPISSWSRRPTCSTSPTRWSGRASMPANCRAGRHLRCRALTDAMRREIEQRMHIDAVDIYGLSEVMGPGVAQECVQSKDGPTIWEDHFTPEIVDPKRAGCCRTGRKGNWCLPA